MKLRVFVATAIVCFAIVVDWFTQGLLAESNPSGSQNLATGLYDPSAGQTVHSVG